METVTDRISRYLLKRVRRRAVLDLYESAAVVELLTSRFVGDGEDSGTAWSITDGALSLLTGDPDRDRAAVARALQRARPIAPPDETEMYDFSHQSDTLSSGCCRTSVMASLLPQEPRTKMNGPTENGSWRRSGCWRCCVSICHGLIRFR